MTKKMENQHLIYFKVENFKKFDSLEVKDIGQFNLIVGDNNVGKTCLLEAFIIDESLEKFSFNLNQILKIRGFIKNEIVKKKIIDLYEDISTNIYKKRFSKDFNSPITFIYKKRNQDIESLKLVDYAVNSWELNKYTLEKEISYSEINELNNEKKSEFINCPFIAFNSNFENDIFNLYNSLKTKSEKLSLIKSLQVIDPNIIDIELRQNFQDLDLVFLLSFKDKDEFFPLNYFGDGFKRIFYIILKILSLRGERIMIDEIENGIYHSRQKEFWKNVILICKELDVQLFATTHSEECIKAFYEASAELSQEENIRLISLEEGKNEKIYATTNRFENIKAGLISNIEFRK